MKRIFKYLKYATISLFIIILVTLSFLFVVLWKYSPELPGYDKIVDYKPNLSSRVYSSDGLLLKSFFVEERIFIPIEKIPKNIINAFISAEDKNFYNHFGIDIFAIIRASLSNIISYYSNKKLIGASTITQQVVKNLLLSNEISYERKIKEIILAIRIEQILTKSQILELYLNDIYLGFGSYGIGTASLNYFNKSVDELELHEIAFLAALPKAPNNYNPTNKYEAALNRRNWVIERMFINKFINNIEKKVSDLPIVTNRRTQNNFYEGEYYYEEIRKLLNKKYGNEILYRDGLIIKTSINTKLQKIADESLISGIIDYDKRQGWRGVLRNIKYNQKNNILLEYNNTNPFPLKWIPVIVIKTKDNKNSIVAEDIKNNKYIIDFINSENKWLDKKKFQNGDIFYLEQKNDLNIIRQLPETNGAVVIIDPHNGNVLAISGGFSYELSKFNRATQAKRQPGSAFKPFVYISALKEGYTPSTLVLDAPYVIDQGPGLPKWKPANYTEEFYGLTTMRTGIEKSRNLMTVRLADKIGIEKILNTANDFGISTYLENQLSMSLGSGLVTLLGITNAYGIIANGGKKIEPKIITSIYSKDGKKIYKSYEKYCKNCKLKKIIDKKKLPKIITSQKIIVDEKIAYQITSMMEGVIKRGTAKKLKKLNISLAGKTGTTNKNKDAWFIGYSPDIVIGVFIGHDTPKSLGYKETGSSVAVPIFQKIVVNSQINKNNIPFRVPSGISFVKIDPTTGEASNQSNSILEPFIFGTEPYRNSINILDSLGTIKNDSISGTGSLLN